MKKQCKTCKTYSSSSDKFGYCTIINDSLDSNIGKDGLLFWSGNDLVYGELLVNQRFGCIFHTERGRE